jgi:hypothetical protein
MRAENMDFFDTGFFFKIILRPFMRISMDMNPGDFLSG